MVQITGQQNRPKPSPRHFTFNNTSQTKLVRRCALILPILGLSIMILCGVYFCISVEEWNGILQAPNKEPSSSSTFSLLKISPSSTVLLKATDRLSYHHEVEAISKKDEDHNGHISGESHIEGHGEHSMDRKTLPSSHANNNTYQPVVIAHVVSLIKCSKEASVTGFLDAAAVLRHSIHKTSVHTKDPTTGEPVSKYSYQMYAIVHAQNCAAHAPLLEGLGYKTLIRNTPVDLDDIINESYRHFVQKENCCGIDEFLKLYSYTLTDHPIIVHWDMDVAILQPLDELYDSMLLDKASKEGRAARGQLQLSFPHQQLPDRIDAFFTKDVTSSQPWEIRQGIQGGFLVTRPSQELFDRYVDLITEGDFLQGRGNGFGWGGLGYGGFQGAMAYQGATSYMYDIIYPGHGVPLNPCVYNQVVADVLWRGPLKMEHHLQCRQYPHEGYTFNNNTIENGACQDCRITPVANTKTVHYTACKKPWECKDPRPRRPRDKNQKYRLDNLTNRTTCHQLFAKWFQLRRDFEIQLQTASLGRVSPSAHDGQYLSHAFLGYCEGPGQYIPMVPPPRGFDIASIYGM